MKAKLTYKTRKRRRVRVDLELPSSGLYLLEGENGSGKSAFFEVLSGQRPYRGRLSFGSYMFKSRRTLSKYTRTQVFRTSLTDLEPVLADLTLNDALALIAEITGLEIEEDFLTVNRKRRILPTSIPFGRLSLGQKSLYLLLLACSFPFEIILLDELFDALDRDVRQFADEILKAKADTALVIAVSHTEKLNIKESLTISDFRLSYDRPERQTAAKPVRPQARFTVRFSDGLALLFSCLTLTAALSTCVLGNSSVGALNTYRERCDMKRVERYGEDIISSGNVIKESFEPDYRFEGWNLIVYGINIYVYPAVGPLAPVKDLGPREALISTGAEDEVGFAAIEKTLSEIGFATVGEFADETRSIHLSLEGFLDFRTKVTNGGLIVKDFDPALTYYDSAGTIVADPDPNKFYYSGVNSNSLALSAILQEKVALGGTVRMEPNSCGAYVFSDTDVRVDTEKPHMIYNVTEIICDEAELLKRNPDLQPLQKAVRTSRTALIAVSSALGVLLGTVPAFWYLSREKKALRLRYFSLGHRPYLKGFALSSFPALLISASVLSGLSFGLKLGQTVLAVGFASLILVMLGGTAFLLFCLNLVRNRRRRRQNQIDAPLSTKRP